MPQYAGHTPPSGAFDERSPDAGLPPRRISPPQQPQHTRTPPHGAAHEAQMLEQQLQYQQCERARATRDAVTLVRAVPSPLSARCRHPSPCDAVTPVRAILCPLSVRFRDPSPSPPGDAA
eukprot:7376022-Prymnesium_polylepis.1